MKKSRQEQDKQHGSGSSNNNKSSSDEDGSVDIPIAQLMNMKKERRYMNGPIQHSTSSQGTTQKSNSQND